LRRILQICVLLLCAATSTWASEYHGQVFCAGLPIPGATVVLTQGAKRLTTITDQQGLYQFSDLADGAWQIEIRMSGFSTLKGGVTVSPNTPQGSWELQMLGLKQMLAKTKLTTPENASLTSKPTEATKGTPENSTAQPENEQDEEESSGGLLINGSVNNASTSQFRLSPAFGNHRPTTKSLYTGGISAIADNSFFDSRPYSLTGLQLPKDGYNRLTTVLTLGGPLNIPHLFYHGPNFFVVYQRTRDRDAVTEAGLVPDAAERNGDLSGLLNPLGQPVTIYDPVTNLPLTGTIPVSPQAQALLSLYPLPNIAGNSRYNYQTQVLNNTHLDALQLRLDQNIGRKDQVYGEFGFESSRSDTANLFHFRDTTDLLGVAAKVNWSHQYHHQMLVLLEYEFSRLRTQVRPQFENRTNISGQAGIGGNDQDPADWGPPSLVFAGGIANLTDAQSSFNRNRTDAVSVKVTNSHWHHTLSFGADYRREEFNIFAQQNPRGTFTFTGLATSGVSSGVSSTQGSDLADFLFGVPDTSAVAFGNPDKYFREPVYDAYVQDDWRIRPELTIDLGLRWEYGAPMTELHGRLVNLDIASGFASIAPVLASNPTGPLTGQKYPNSLLRPDKRGFEPRIGVAWRPIPASTLVVRGGYGVYDDTSVYLSIAQMMAQQAPLSRTLTEANSEACPLSLKNGFLNCAGATANTFAVDPDFRVGYAQEWNLSVQRDLPGALVMSATYSGVKGSHGMQESLPNTFPVGAVNLCPSCPAGFVYLGSNGTSMREAGEFDLRRRLRSGLTAKVAYTYAKASDDDSQVGAQSHLAAQGESQSKQSQFSNSQSSAPPMIAQDWRNLRGEYGRSTFDQRHLFKVEIQYTTGMGLAGGTLLSGWKGTLFKEWTFLSQISVGSGLPEDPVFLAAVPGTGVTGTIRPDVTGAPIQQTSDGRFLNPAAYTAPAPGQWGTARRNSITGPSQFNLDASLARTFRLRGKYNLDVRADATNLLNHATFTAWNTTVNSTTFGLPVAVNPMRSLQLTGRLRF
jgi:Carboxypeptidase regulatory-like domain